MSYILVNKNFLIPEIIKSDNLNKLIQQMVDYTQNMNNEYIMNVYIVYEDSIYFTNNNEIYILQNNSINKFETNVVSNKSLNIIYNFINNKSNNNVSLKQQPKKHNSLSFSIPEPINFSLIEKQDKIIVEELTEEELTILKLIEETQELYEKERFKIKEIENKIKTIDNNNNKLKKQKEDKEISNFSKLKNDYKTYNKIRKNIEKEPNQKIPELFKLKYNYFKKLITNEDNKKKLDKIERIEINDIFNNKYKLDNEIIELSNMYENDTKKLNVSFDYSWEQLAHDIEITEGEKAIKLKKSKPIL
jgi:hypothetical protein